MVRHLGFRVLLLGCVAAMSAEAGQWSLTGTDAQLGNYSGTLSISPSGVVTHAIRFEQYRFRGMPVEEVWQTNVLPVAGQREAHFPIKLTSHIVKYENQTQTTQADLVVKLTIPQNSFQWSYLNRREQVTPVGGTAGEIQLGTVSKIPSADRPSGPVSVIARTVARRFYQLPEMRPFISNPQLRRGLHFVTRDTVNYDFYRGQPGTLRVVDAKATDFSSMAEFLRYEAYSYNLTQKAQAQDTRMQRLMIDSFGLVSHPHLDESGKLKGHEGELSSALWTGVYILSQSWRYEATRDAQALANIRRSFQGMLMLAEIHDEPQEFARSLRVSGEPWQDPHDSNWRKARASYGNVDYHARGNNDMLRGLVMGLLVSYQTLPDISSTDKARVVTALKRLTQSRIAQSRSSNELYAAGALAMVEKTPANVRAYRDAHNRWRRSLGNLTPPIKGSGIITDWSGNFLGLVADLLLERIHSELRPDAIKPLLERSEGNWDDIKLLRPTPHTFFLAAMRSKYPGILRAVPDAQLEDARWALREMLREKPGIDFEINHAARPDFVPSPYPALFWKFIDGEDDPEGRMLSLVAPPLFASYGSDHMIWRLSPFGYKSGAIQGAPRAGTDYLVAYWLARRYGLIGAND